MKIQKLYCHMPVKFFITSSYWVPCEMFVFMRLSLDFGYTLREEHFHTFFRRIYFVKHFYQYCYIKFQQGVALCKALQLFQ